MPKPHIIEAVAILPNDKPVPDEWLEVLEEAEAQRLTVLNNLPERAKNSNHDNRKNPPSA